MQVSSGTALDVLDRIRPALKTPSFHPSYVLADSLREPGLAPVFLVHEEGGEIFYHAFLLGAVNEGPWRDVQAPYGYGGPISTTTDPEFLRSAWTQSLEWSRNNKVLVEFLRFHPLLENWRCYGGDSRDDRETVWVDLSAPDLLASYETRARTAVRKAEKSGLVVEWVGPAEFLAVFPALYGAAMQALGAGADYLFPRAYHEALAASPGTQLAFCRAPEGICAGAIFLNDGYTLEYHLSASTPEGRRYGAANLMLHKAFERARSLGCQRAHLGGGTNASRENPLLFFKSGFSKGRARFRIGFHVHDRGAYESLRHEWERAGTGREQASRRVLFYR